MMRTTGLILVVPLIVLCMQSNPSTALSINDPEGNANHGHGYDDDLCTDCESDGGDGYQNGGYGAGDDGGDGYQNGGFGDGYQNGGYGDGYQNGGYGDGYQNGGYSDDDDDCEEYENEGYGQNNYGGDKYQNGGQGFGGHYHVDVGQAN